MATGNQGGTLGLPAGLPSDSIPDLTNYLEVGEPGISGPTGIVDSDNAKVRWANKELIRAEPHVMAQREQSNDCYRFRDGHQLSSVDEQLLKSQKRPNTAFNEIQKFLNFVTGIERRTQQALLYLPRNAEDVQAQTRGEWKTKLYEWFMDQSNGSQARSRAFEDMIVGGLGWVDIGVTKVTNPHGAPRYVRVPSDQMMYPENESQNMVGSRWMARENYMDVTEAMLKWPDSSVFLRAAAGGAANEDAFPDFGRGAGRPIQYVVPWIMTEPLNKNGGGPSSGKPGKVPICEFQFFDDDAGYYFFDPLEKEDVWLNESDFRKYKSRLAKLYDAEITDYDPTTKRVYKRMFMLQRRILLEAPKALPTNGEHPSFTWNVMTGTWDREDKCWYGLTRVLMDPQRYANAMSRQILELMGAATKGGYLAETGAITVSQKHDIEESGSRPGAINMVQPDSLRTGRIIPKPIPQVPAGTLAVWQAALDQIEKVTGISTQMIGSIQGAVPGISLRRQLTAGMVLLAAQFDSLSMFRKQEGYAVADFLKLIADDRLVRIGGAFDAQSIQLKRDIFDEYDDIILDENDQDPNMRQLYMDSILQLAPVLIKTGHFLPDLLDYMPLPIQLRQKLKQAMEQSAQQQQQMAMQGLSVGGRGKPRSLEEVKAQTQLTQARSAEHIAKAGMFQKQAQHLTAQAQATTKAIRRDDMEAILKNLLDMHKARKEENRSKAELLLKSAELGVNAFGMVGGLINDRNKNNGSGDQ